MYSVEIRDRDGNLVTDPYRLPVQIRDWTSTWPGGFGRLRGLAQPGHTLAGYRGREGYGIRVYDGAALLYDGLLTDLQAAGSGIELQAAGWYTLLEERRLRKRWIDTAAFDRFYQVSSPFDPPFVFKVKDKRADFLAGTRDVNRTDGDMYKEQYDMPVGNYVRRVTYGWRIRSGEGLGQVVYNLDQAANETTNEVTSATVVASTEDHTFTQGDTDSVQFGFWCKSTDLYDQNDYVIMTDLVVYAKMDNFASPTYTGGEILEDVIYLLADGEISEDFSQIADPGRVLSPFLTLGDNWEFGSSLAQRIAAHSDSSDNVYGLAVWGSDKSSDGLPQAYFTYVDETDYDYQAKVNEAAEFTDYGAVLLANWVVVGYTDERSQRRFRSPNNDSNLKDQDSIDKYGRRDSPVLNVGSSTSTLASNIGVRYLDLHKDLESVVEVSLRGTVLDKHGQRVPVSRIRAGQRIKLTDWQGGKIYWIYKTRYDVATDTLTLSTEPIVDPVRAAIQNLRQQAK